MISFEAASGALIDAGRLLGAAGLSPGTTGNLSMKVGDTVIMTGTGARLGALTPEDLSFLDLEGSVVGGARPTKEAMLHILGYQVRPEARAIVHLHSPAVLAASCLADLPTEEPLPPYTPYYVMRAGRVRLVDYFAPGDEELAVAVSETLAVADTALLRRHGSVCIAKDLGAAVAASEELEANADIHLRLGGRAATVLNAGEIAALQKWRN